VELPGFFARNNLRIVNEIVKRAPSDCPSKAVAVGASALLVVAASVMARLAITRPEEVLNVHSEDMCRSCPVRPQCKYSLVK
jgi:hypothetical protein